MPTHTGEPKEGRRQTGAERVFEDTWLNTAQAGSKTRTYTSKKLENSNGRSSETRVIKLPRTVSKNRAHRKRRDSCGTRVLSTISSRFLVRSHGSQRQWGDTFKITKNSRSGKITP